MSYEYLSEDEGSYKLKHPAGHEVVIAKQAISDALHAKIKGMAPIKVAEGGRAPGVPSMLDPSAVDTPDMLTQAVNTPLYEKPSADEVFKQKLNATNQQLDAMSQINPGDPSIPILRERAGINTMAQMSKDQAAEQTAAQLAANRKADDAAKLGDMSQKLGITPGGYQVATNAALPADALKLGGERPGGAPGGGPGPGYPTGDGMPLNPKLDADYTGNLLKEFGAAGQQQVAAQQQLSNANVKALQTDAEARKNAAEGHLAEVNKINSEYDARVKDITDFKIDPNRAWTNTSTPGKISSVIGLIIGGIGAGMTRGPNYAIEALNRVVDNDLMAQKAELGKKETLLSANMRKYQNVQQAYANSKLEMAANVQGQLQIAANQAATPMAKAALAQQMVTLKTQLAPLQAQTARLNWAMKSNNPSAQISVIVPEPHQQKAYEELKSMQELNNGAQNFTTTFDKLNQMGTAGRLIHPGATDALVDPLLTKLSKDTAGRFTEADAGMIKPLFPAAGDSEKTLQLKRAQGLKILMEKAHSPLLDAWGIKYKATPVQTYSASDLAGRK